MGEAIKLVNTFKVKKVIFNVANYNNLEDKLIEILDSKDINHYQGLNTLNIDKYELQKYYNVGKLLQRAGNNYGEGIIRGYSEKLTKELGKKYSVRYLFNIRRLYLFSKVHPLGAQLTMSHYRLLFPLDYELV